MNNSVEYKDGKLIISYVAMQKYLKGLKKTYNILKGTSNGSENFEPSELSAISYSNDDYIPFRILDGDFIPYAETSVFDYDYQDQNGHTIKKKKCIMKTMIGTIVIDDNIGVQLVNGYNAQIFDQYNIPNKLSGSHVKLLYSVVKNFPSTFHNSLKEGKDIELAITQNAYDALLLTAPLKILDPISINFNLSLVNQEVLEKNNEALKSMPSTQETINNNNIKAIFQLKDDQYNCLNKIGHLFNKNTTQGITLNLDDSTSNEIIEYLAKPSELNYSIIFGANYYKLYSSVPKIALKLPIDFGNSLAHRLEFKSNQIKKSSSVEIILNKEELLARNIEEFISNTINQVFTDIELSEKTQLISYCGMFYNKTSDCTIDSNGICTTLDSNG